MGVTKGFLVAIGGAEDKGQNKAEHHKQQESNDLDFHSEGVLNEIQDLLKGRDPVIEVITTATSEPDESFRNYHKAFSKLGVTAHHLKILTRDDASDKNYVKRLERCSGVMITGGDQSKLSSIIGGTPAQDALMYRYQNDHFVIAGTSAGAACMSTVMMGGGSSDKGNIKGEVKLAVGLGFIGNIIIDTHFDTRVRFARLAEAIAYQPGIIGVGLGEDTGVIIEKGDVINVIGSDSVTIIDGSNIFYNNIADIKEGKPISIAKLDIYLVSRYDKFELNARKFIPDPAAGKMKKDE
jgi:cyanophycinase